MATRTLHTAFQAGDVTAAAVLAFREEHRLGRPAEATVTVELGAEADPEELVGCSAILAFASGTGPEHTFAGVIEAVTIIGSPAAGGGGAHRARFHVVSQMALLARSVGSEIHQELDVKEIASKVLEKHGIPTSMQDWRLTGTYPKREYCVQYNESALAFVSRLLEEEGIYFRSACRPGQGEILIFEDDSTAFEPIEGASEVPFRPRAGLERDEDAIYAITEQKRVVSGKFVLRDYDFKRPKLDLTCEAAGDADTDLEVYDYPGQYVEASEGKRLAAVRLEAERATRSALGVEADCTRAEVGRKLTITRALHEEINGDYVITAVVHELDPGDDKDARPLYVARATLIPADVRFRTPRTTPAPIIAGPQTARVVAPAGSPVEEIHTDEHGRVKVKFHWDLGPAEDDKASCWMRVGQLQTSGSMVLPRLDWEVIVEFLEGNPDRPIVTGRLYNGLFMPPYALPEGKTRTSMQSASTPGGGGSNEIRFEDKAGAEELMIHAQHDQTLATANNKTKTVGNNETRSVGVDESVTVGANEDIKITKGWESKIGADQTVSVGGNRSVEVNAVAGLTAGGSSSTSVGGNHSEMDGNPLQALLALAVQTVAEMAAAAAAEQLAAVDAAVSARVDQALGPIQALESQAGALGEGMRAVANGDLGAAAPLLGAAAALPRPGAFASSLGGGAAPRGLAGGGAMGRPAAFNAAGGPGTSTAAIAAGNALSQAVNGAVQGGVNAAGNALGAALGLDGGGGGGSSAANEAGPAGDVAGVDAEDRAKGPGHSLNKVTGSHSESIGGMKIAAALSGVMTNVTGSLSQDIGTARLEMVLGNRAESVEGSKTETALGLVVVSMADESETVGGSKTTMVGGAILEKIDGSHNITAGSPASFVGAFHKIEAKTMITLKCGASEVVIDDSGISMTSPLVTITAGKVALTKSVSQI